ncbi:MAG: YihY/virulence factor BrkB family protein [Eubacteriaceae bacterium]|nr:YihY/virulence factor BrkB family protein [Eubacteriaceae bacterium]
MARPKAIERIRNFLKHEEITPGKIIKNTPLFVMQDFTDMNMLGLAMQMSFIFLLVLLPVLYFTIYLFQGNIFSAYAAQLINFLGRILPKVPYNFLLYFLKNARFNMVGSTPLMILVFIVSMFIAASNIMSVVNTLYEMPKRRTWTSHLITAVEIIVITGIIIFIMFSSQMFANAFFLGLLKGFQNPLASSIIVQAFTHLITLTAEIILFTFVFTIAPTVKTHFMYALPGAIFTTLSTNIVFRIFITMSNSSDKYILVFGPLGALLMLMFSIDLICLFIIIGIRINVYIQLAKDGKIIDMIKSKLP